MIIQADISNGVRLIVVLLNPQKLCFTHHPTLKSSETPMYKGIEASVEYP